MVLLIIMWVLAIALFIITIVLLLKHEAWSLSKAQAEVLEREVKDLQEERKHFLVEREQSNALRNKLIDNYLKLSTRHEEVLGVFRKGKETISHE